MVKEVSHLELLIYVILNSTTVHCNMCEVKMGPLYCKTKYAQYMVYKKKRAVH
jgi:hypothetical protein